MIYVLNLIKTFTSELGRLTPKYSCYRVQTGSGAHPASISVGTGGPFLEVKAAGA